MEIKINLEPTKKELFEDFDKYLKESYSKLDVTQQISVKKQILGLKDEQYSFELKLIQLNLALKEIAMPVVTKPIERLVRKEKAIEVDEDISEENVSEENSETIEL